MLTFVEINGPFQGMFFSQNVVPLRVYFCQILGPNRLLISPMVPCLSATPHRIQCTFSCHKTIRLVFNS